MKFMTMVTSSLNSQGKFPPPALMEAIFAFGKEAQDAGVLVQQGHVARDLRDLRGVDHCGPPRLCPGIPARGSGAAFAEDCALAAISRSPSR